MRANHDNKNDNSENDDDDVDETDDEDADEVDDNDGQCENGDGAMYPADASANSGGRSSR